MSDIFTNTVGNVDSLADDSLIWQQVANELPLRIYVKAVDDDFRFVLCNDYLCKELGMTSDEIIGKRAEDIFSPDVAEYFTSITIEAVRHGDVHVAESSYFDNKGIARKFITTESLYTAEDGCRYILGYAQDVTEEKNIKCVERTIAEIAAMPFENKNETSFKRVFDVMSRPDCLDIMDARWRTRNGKVYMTAQSNLPDDPKVEELNATETAEVWKLLRKRVDENGILIYTNFSEEEPEISRELSMRTYPCFVVLPYKPANEEYTGELICFFRTQQLFSERYIEMLKLLTRTLSVTYNRVILFNDLTNQLHCAEDADKDKNTFFASVSHDIRTPLNSIIGFSELLSDSKKLDPATRKRYVDSISTSGQQLLQLVNDVLDLAKLDAGKMQLVPEICNFHILADEINSIVMPTAKNKKIEIKINIPHDLPFISIDRQRIRQILYNLADNAVKFTDEGLIEISAEFVKDSDSDAPGSNTGTFRFSVTDSGCGISESDLQLIAQPFVKVCRADQRSGAGLGLSICHRIVSQMNGTITIESELGAGSTFLIEIPNIHFIKDSPPELDAPNLPTKSLHHNPEFNSTLNVLLVDDMNLNLQVIKTMLCRLGVKNVTTTQSGRDALVLLDDAEHPFNLVLTDMWMPEMGGAELVAAIRANPRFNALPVFAVTADVEILRTYKDLGFTGTILKPVTLKSLAKHLEHLGNRHSYN